jgi:branched-chain amino acid transport system ATP-binding protein
MLEVDNIEAGYGAVKVLFGVSLDVKPGEILCLLGRNGAGKTTILKSIMGLLPVSAGSIRFDGRALPLEAAHRIAQRGIAYVPQGRRLFAELTVAQNIEVGLMVHGHGRQTRERVLELFPRLRERLKQRAETLSGGEQQMLAMARALSTEPRLLLLDEPTEGLQPSMVQLIDEVTIKMKREGVAIVLVEHHLDTVLSLADRVAFIENGRNPETISSDELAAAPDKVMQYLGVS